VSVAGRSLRNGVDSWKTDPRTNCIHECFHAFETIRPRAFSVESVVPLYKRARELVDSMAERAVAMGYSVTHVFINAAWHGVPQTRKRYFFLATRGRFEPVRLNYAPPPTVGEVMRELEVELGDEVGFVPPSRHSYVYEKLKPGQDVREVWEQLNPPETWVRSAQGVSGRPRMMEYRLDPSKPMGAFIGDFFVHPTKPRRLGLREALRLCNFPDDWQFACPPSHAYSELARGVMPPVADWLARGVRQTLEREDASEPAVAIVDFRKPPQGETHA
jgi:site-specific DNA-cytosine methylase